MYVNAKMIPVETVPGIWKEDGTEQWRRGILVRYYLTHFKNLCKCYNVYPPNLTIK
jgi:hypothetical protein